MQDGHVAGPSCGTDLLVAHQQASDRIKTTTLDSVLFRHRAGPREQAFEMKLEEYLNPYTEQPETGSNQGRHRWVTVGGDES